MNRGKRSILIAVLFVAAGIIIGLGTSSSLNIFTNGYTQEIKISKDSLDILGKINQAVAEVAGAVTPAVVNISSTKTVHMRNMPSPFLDDPFFRNFFGGNLPKSGKQRDFKESGLGSGVIVTGEGYILTNNHVIDGADEISVRLSDKRVFKGKVVGADPKTDLAVVKISADKLPYLKLGDSDSLKVGEMVIAVGNPYGLNQTVTSGIISAKGRADVGLAEYEDFLQTDAPINPGNSGGAMVNVRGELIGINTAILSSSGGSEGVGLAIPSNMARTVMDSLIRKGKVVRGWLGISIQSLTPELAKQLNLKNEKGALIAEVVDDSPASRAGLQRGDVVLEFDGKEVADAGRLKNMVAGVKPGQDVKVKFNRNGSEKTLTVRIDELTVKAQRMMGQVDNQFRGVTVQNLTPDIKRNMQLPGRLKGVIVADIANDTPAAEVLVQGDVILEINRQKIESVADYNRIVSGVKSGKQALVLIYRNGSSIYITF